MCLFTLKENIKYVKSKFSSCTIIHVISQDVKRDNIRFHLFFTQKFKHNNNNRPAKAHRRLLFSESVLTYRT